MSGAPAVLAHIESCRHSFEGHGLHIPVPLGPNSFRKSPVDRLLMRTKSSLLPVSFKQVRAFLALRISTTAAWSLAPCSLSNGSCSSPMIGGAFSNTPLVHSQPASRPALTPSQVQCPEGSRRFTGSSNTYPYKL